MLGSRIFKGSEHGQTLTEVLVALAILAAVGVTFLAGMQTSSKAVIIGQQNVTAESLAKSKMEEVKTPATTYVTGATSYYVTPIPSDLASQGYGITVAAAALHNPDDGIQRITVTVTYNGDVMFTIADYKVKRSM